MTLRGLLFSNNGGFILYKQHIYTVSSMHISTKTWLWLEREAAFQKNANLVVYPKAQYGFFIALPSMKELVSIEIPDDLKEIVTNIPDSEDYWLAIDVDADLSPELPKHH